MPVVRFLKDFPWKPLASVTIAYKAGMELLVTTRCANAAVEKGKAERVQTLRVRPSRAASRPPQDEGRE